MRDLRLSPAAALAIGFGALALALAAAVSAAPRLAGWLAPAPAAEMIGRTDNPRSDLTARLTELTGGHGVELVSLSVSAAGDATMAEMQVRAEEARMLRYLQALEIARPALSLRRAELNRTSVTPAGGVVLEARLTIAARYAP
jgi:hypothetical protein